MQKRALLDILGARFLLLIRSNKLPLITLSFHLKYTRKLVLPQLLRDQTSFSLPFPWTEPDTGKLWAQGAFYQVEQEMSQGGHCITLSSSEKKTLSLLSSVVIHQTQKALINFQIKLPPPRGHSLFMVQASPSSPQSLSKRSPHVTGQPKPASLDIQI